MRECSCSPAARRLNVPLCPPICKLPLPPFPLNASPPEHMPLTLAPLPESMRRCALAATCCIARSGRGTAVGGGDAATVEGFCALLGLPCISRQSAWRLHAAGRTSDSGERD